MFLNCVRRRRNRYFGRAVRTPDVPTGTGEGIGNDEQNGATGVYMSAGTKKRNRQTGLSNKKTYKSTREQ